jgi:hypothetical protein
VLVVGIVLIVVGISDIGIAALIARNQAAGAPGGLGETAEPPAVVRILKLSGAFTVLVGVVLAVVGLAS